MDTITYYKLCRSIIYLSVCKKKQPKPLNDGSSRQFNRVRVKKRNKLCSLPHKLYDLKTASFFANTCTGYHIKTYMPNCQ